MKVTAFLTIGLMVNAVIFGFSAHLFGLEVIPMLMIAQANAFFAIMTQESIRNEDDNGIT